MTAKIIPFPWVIRQESEVAACGGCRHFSFVHDSYSHAATASWDGWCNLNPNVPQTVKLDHWCRKFEWQKWLAD